MKNFVESDCLKRRSVFFNPMTKTQLETIATAVKKVSVSDSKEMTILSVNTDLQLFGRLVVIAKSRYIDLINVLQHELN